jgi:hypothetical protein
MLKGLLVVVAIVVVGGASYFIAAFSTSFSNGICYSRVIGGIAEEAKSAIRIGGSTELQRFEGFITSLPLYGYETNCGDLEAAIKQRRGKT